jgi:hypothetical protein
MTDLKTLNEFKEHINATVSKKELRQEAIKRIKQCCGNHRILETMCNACQRDAWFYGITFKEKELVFL